METNKAGSMVSVFMAARLIIALAGLAPWLVHAGAQIRATAPSIQWTVPTTEVNSGPVKSPHLEAQTGHGFTIQGIAFSPDGKIIASAATDGAVKLWDVATGRVLHTFAFLDSPAVCRIALFPDGKTGMVMSDEVLHLWDVGTGRVLRTGIIRKGGSLCASAVSPDGKTVASGVGIGTETTIELWDVTTGRVLRKLVGHEGSVLDVAFSSDGKFLVSASEDHTIKHWNVATGQLLKTFQGHASGVYGVSYTPDGTALVSTSKDQTLKLWNVSTGRELRAFNGFEGVVYKVVFYPDAKSMLSIGPESGLKSWDVNTGQELRTFLREDGSYRSDIVFSPDGKTVVTAGRNLTLWDVATERAIHTFSGQADRIECAAFSPDGKTILSSGGATKLWDGTGRELRKYVGKNSGCAAFSPNGQTIAGSTGIEVLLWDVATGRELRTFEASGERGPVAFSPDGKELGQATVVNSVQLWDVSSGRKLHSFAGGGGWENRLVFSRDGKTLVSVAHDGLEIWDVATRVKRRTLPGKDTTAVDVSPDGRLIASGRRGDLIFSDANTGQTLASLPAHHGRVSSIAFSPDGKTLLSGGLDHTITLWDVTTAKKLRTFAGHAGWVFSVGFSPDGQIAVSTGFDRAVKLWRVSDGALLATLTSFDDGNWAVTDSEGRYDSSNGGDNPHLHWVFDNTPIDLSQLKDRYYDPGLLAKILGYNKEALRTIPKFEDALLRKWPDVALSRDAQNPLRLNIRLTDRGDGYGRVRVRLNGKELTANAAAGKALSGKTVQLSLDLATDRLLPGDNRIDVVAWPKVGHIPSQASQLIVAGAASRGGARIGSSGKLPPLAEPVTLHAVVMGVSQYAGAQLRLAFSGKDAVDFASALELGGARLFGAERVRLHRFSDYSPKEATVPADMLPSRDNLKRAFDTIAKEAKAGDILLVYLAGHGVMTPGAAGEAEYYYLSREAQSTDLSDPAVRKLWGTSSTDLTDWIKRIKATKQVLILDTCAAGGAIDKLVAKRQIPGAQIIALEQLKDRTGMHILAGAAADKVSFEATQFGQGLLTYALLTGMKGAALKDEIIDVQKLFQYTREEVPKLAKQIGGIQEPRLSAPQGESFAIGRMDEEDRKKVPLARVKLMIQRATFQDETRMIDVLKLGKRFDDRMKLETYAASRGKMVYVDTDDFPDAWQVSGRYRKEANGLRVSAKLFQGEIEKAAFDVVLPLEEEKQADALLTAVIKEMVGSTK